MPDPIQVTPEAPPVNSVAPPTAPNLPPPSVQPTLDTNPAPSFSDVMSGQPSVPPDLGPNPQMPTLAAPSKPGVWRSVVTGALAGLAGSAGQKSFGGGLSAGAAGELAQERYQHQQANEDANALANVQWKNVQAAHLVGETALNSAKLHALPEQMAALHDEQALEMVKTLGSMGIRPSMIVSNTPDHATAALQSLNDTHGAVPPMYTVALGKQLIGFNLDALAQKTSGDNPVLKNVVNLAGQLNGRPDIDEQTWNAMDQPSKTKILETAFNTLNTAPPTADNVASLAATAANQLSTYQSLAPGKQDPAVLKQLQSKVNFYTKAAPGLFASKAALEGQKQAAKSQAEAAAKGAKPDVLTGAMPDGTIVAGTADELAAAGVKNPYKLPAADVSKMTIARGLIAPGGTFSNVADDIAALNKAGELNGVANRWNAILTNKLGAGDEKYARLASDMNLLTTAIMNAHVGAKGSHEFLEHFKETVGDPSISTAPILLSRLGASWDYMRHKAMLIPQAKGGK